MARLTDRAVKTAGAGRYGDGDGLQLVVSDNGRRKWVLRFQLNGARRDMELGSYPAVSLSEARIAAADARKLIAQNVDPLDARAASRKAAKPIPTFEEIAKIMIDEAQHKSTNAKVRYQWERAPARFRANTDNVSSPLHSFFLKPITLQRRAFARTRQAGKVRLQSDVSRGKTLSSTGGYVILIARKARSGTIPGALHP